MKQASQSDRMGMPCGAEVVSADPSSGSDRRLAMYTIGLDVHVRRSTFVVLDENGKELMNRTVHGPMDKVITELKQVKQPFQICWEGWRL